MKEIGGYIELDTYRLPMLHEGAVALNCGRNCLDFLIRAKGIKKISLPRFLCDSVQMVCKQENVQVRFYSVDQNFLPKGVKLVADEYLYLVNYYGQLSNEYIADMKGKYENIIVDNAQAYFQMPVSGVDTLYTCRKFFGVPDGAFLYTDASLPTELEQDVSFGRMQYLLGRYERTASEFYGEYIANNKAFATEPIKKMSKLTENLLHGIDYDFVQHRRSENYKALALALDNVNRLHVTMSNGAFAYPLWVQDGSSVRKKLLENKIYIPILWPNVEGSLPHNSLEYDLTRNILPLPVDQRYDILEMNDLAAKIMSAII